jgi:hypothetical protein
MRLVIKKANDMSKKRDKVSEISFLRLSKSEDLRFSKFVGRIGMRYIVKRSEFGGLVRYVVRDRSSDMHNKTLLSDNRRLRAFYDEHVGNMLEKVTMIDDLRREVEVLNETVVGLREHHLRELENEKRVCRDMREDLQGRLSESLLRLNGSAKSLEGMKLMRSQSLYMVMDMRDFLEALRGFYFVRLFLGSRINDMLIKLNDFIGRHYE